MSNLPPGVNENMIPGNRPEDSAFEQWAESLDYEDIAEALVDSIDWPKFEGRYQVSPRRVLARTIGQWLGDLEAVDVGTIGAQFGCNQAFDDWFTGPEPDPDRAHDERREREHFE